GMLSSRGKYLLFADADGATKFSELEKLEQEMVKLTIEDEVSSFESGWERPALAFGSRAHLERQSIAKRSLFRTFLMYGFHLVVWTFGVRGIKDTQCGFKLFTRQAARLCFANLHVMRWYLEARCKSEEGFTYEVIVVDDGSSDRTTEIGRKYSKNYGTAKVRVLTLLENRGKGGAVTMGMLSSRGKYLLFADADGATKFSELEKLEQEMVKLTIEDEVSSFESGWERPALAFGSRAHLERQSIAKRSLFRTFLMYGFHLVVWTFGVRGIKDTQCGFKLFTRQAARLCFANLHVMRWAFDVELFRIVRYFQMKTAEVAVEWTEIEGEVIFCVE
ncbi:unnamed protein product, partial [Cyprideis torosa]